MRMCGAADVLMFRRVNCREILRGLSADVMGKMRRCGYNAFFFFSILKKDLHVPTSSSA